MRFQVVVLAFGLSAVGCTQAAPLFSDAERAQIRKFWSAPGRYTIQLPAEAKDKGAWQVRQTVASSVWLWNYSKGRKGSNPVDGGEATTPDPVAAEQWINARLARDRWEALMAAQNANEKQFGVRMPLADSSFPQVEPPNPGPAPKFLVDAFGPPPRFAESCVPMEYRVAFDDMTISYQDRRKMGSPRYAFYRYDQGVGDGGTAVKSMSQERLDGLFRRAGVSDTESRIMRSVSILEGGFDAVNTYDTGYVSIGFIQFACLREGGGSLGSMLLRLKREDPKSFDSDFRRFGLDVTADGKLAALDLETGEELTGPAAANAIIEDKRLVAAFQRAGRVSDSFIACQIKAAKEQYLPAQDDLKVSYDGKTITGKVCDVVKSEAGLAILMDRKVNGKYAAFFQVMSEIAAELKPESLSDLAPYERLIVERLRFRKDFLADNSLSQPLAAPPRVTTNSSRGGNTRSGRGGGG